MKLTWKKALVEGSSSTQTSKMQGVLKGHQFARVLRRYSSPILLNSLSSLLSYSNSSSWSRCFTSGNILSCLSVFLLNFIWWTMIYCGRGAEEKTGKNGKFGWFLIMFSFLFISFLYFVTCWKFGDFGKSRVILWMLF